MTRYLTLQDVLGIHDIQLAEYGGATGVRDPGQLEAALFRPQTGYYADLIAEAAALWESLSQNQPLHRWKQKNGFCLDARFPDHKWIPTRCNGAGFHSICYRPL